MQIADNDKRVRVLKLLRDVAESEHQLRHKAGFAELVEEVGMSVKHEPHRVTVECPIDEAEKAAAAEAAAAEAAAAETVKAAK